MDAKKGGQGTAEGQAGGKQVGSKALGAACL
jgi:hypothetical protein